MTRGLLLCCAAAVLMGNAINVSTGPRLMRPRALEVGTPLTVAEGESFLQADVLSADYLTLSAPFEFQHRLLAVTLPEGTVLENFVIFRRDESDPVIPVYCSQSLVRLLGGKERLPVDMDRRIALTYKLCFFANAERDQIERVFVAGGLGNYEGIGQFEPVKVTHGTTPRETGTQAYWELNDIWGGTRKPLAKMLTVFDRGENDELAGQRIIWERGPVSGTMSALIPVGTKDAPLPAAIAAVFGVYDVTILSVDTKAKTLTYSVDAIHPPATFVDRAGTIAGGYSPVTVVVPGG